ncbi:hypothetical protein, partial [Rosistilla oblonga]|uniref:hypothetical protein n=1 Tax=Rosistilla oblonga TaxID=2527990 RepID=UPI003A98410E
MNTLKQRWPCYLRVILIAASVGITGFIINTVGRLLPYDVLDGSQRDDISAVGSAMMSACSLTCVFAWILAAIHWIRCR